MEARPEFTINLRSKHCGKTILLFVFYLIVIAFSFVILSLYCTTFDEEFFIDVPFVPTPHEISIRYDKWLVDHYKNYTDGEKERRFEIFKDNLWFVLDHNSKSNVTYKLGLNRFADLTNDEFRSMFVGGGSGRVITSDEDDDRFKYASFLVADTLPLVGGGGGSGRVIKSDEYDDRFKYMSSVADTLPLVGGGSGRVNKSDEDDGRLKYACPVADTLPLVGSGSGRVNKSDADDGQLKYACSVACSVADTLSLVGGGSGRVNKSNKDDGRFKYASLVADTLPQAIDWRDRGAVAPIRYQGQNSSDGSWAFSAVGAVEGINHIVTGQLIPLSEQELFDCHRGFDQGCSSVGCRMDSAFEFIVENGGIHAADDYPDKGIRGQCDYTLVHNPKVVTIIGFENVPQNDENSLKKAVAHQPVSVSVEAGGRAFQLYESGIFTGSCGTELDHGVLAVGYGTEDGKDYWIVRNSWGTSWGEKGYMRLERNVASTDSGRCGIAMQPSYPTKVSNPVCDDFFSCPGETTCCCVYELGKRCYGWGCCPAEAATCCDDRSSCCPQKFPVCDVKTRTCLLSKESPIGIEALKPLPAKPNWNLIIASRKFLGP